jgi:hypothetical protein
MQSLVHPENELARGGAGAGYPYVVLLLKLRR